MSATLLQYPPSPSSRSRDSYLSLENSRRESMISTSAASYETALAGPPSALSRTGSMAGDEPQSLTSSPQLGPVNLLTKDHNDNTPPIHITRVSQDTLLESSARGPRAVGIGKAMVGALDPAAHNVASIVAHPMQRPHPDIIDLSKQQSVARLNPTVVEGPNGLTPPPSPPSTEGFRLRSGVLMPDRPTCEEPVPIDLGTLRPSTPTRSTSYSNGPLSACKILGYYSCVHNYYLMRITSSDKILHHQLVILGQRRQHRNNAYQKDLMEVSPLQVLPLHPLLYILGYREATLHLRLFKGCHKPLSLVDNPYHYLHNRRFSIARKLQLSSQVWTPAFHPYIPNHRHYRLLQLRLLLPLSPHKPPLSSSIPLVPPGLQH